jgi:hypothetical protein
MRWSWFLVVPLALGVGCKGGSSAALEAKCDASLRVRVEQLAGADADSLLDVLGRATVSLDETHQKKLESAGARIQLANGDMFTARIPVKRMGHVASLDFVKSLALSQAREPLTP